MASNPSAWLLKVMEQKTAAGAPLYRAETLQDLVALVLLTSKKPLGRVPDHLAKILAAFMARSGLSKAKDAASLKKALDGYFRSHPLPAALTASLQAEFKRSYPSKKPPARPAARRG